MIQFYTHVKKTKEILTIEVEYSEALRSFFKTYYNEKIPHHIWEKYSHKNNIKSQIVWKTK